MEVNLRKIYDVIVVFVVIIIADKVIVRRWVVVIVPSSIVVTVVSVIVKVARVTNNIMRKNVESVVTVIMQSRIRILTRIIARVVVVLPGVPVRESG